MQTVVLKLHRDTHLAYQVKGFVSSRFVLFFFFKYKVLKSPSHCPFLSCILVWIEVPSVQILGDRSRLDAWLSSDNHEKGVVKPGWGQEELPEMVFGVVLGATQGTTCWIFRIVLEDWV